MNMFSSFRSCNGRSLSKTISPTETRLPYQLQFTKNDSYACQHQDMNLPETPPISPISSPCFKSNPSSPRTFGDFNLGKEQAKFGVINKRETTEKVSNSGSTNSRIRLLNPLKLLTRRRSSQFTTQALSEESRRHGSEFSSEGLDPRIQGALIHDFSVSRRARNEISCTNPQFTDEKTANLRGRVYTPEISGEIECLKNSWNGDNVTPISIEDSEEKVYPPPELNISNNVNLPSPNSSRSYDFRETHEVTEQKISCLSHEKATESHWNACSLDAWNRTIHADDYLISPKAMVPSLNDTDGKLNDSNLLISQFPTKEKANFFDISDLPSDQKLSRAVSSEFSFDVKGDSTQERLLEEKHRKKTAEKFRELNERQDSLNKGTSNDFAKYYSEENSPNVPKSGVNSDAEESELPIKLELNSRLPFQAESCSNPVNKVRLKDSMEKILIHGVNDQPREFLENQSLLSQPSYNDFYYDDGIIATDQNFCGSLEFDESIFDRDDTDQYGQPFVKFSLPLWDAQRVSRSVSSRSVSPLCIVVSDFPNSGSYQLDLSSDSCGESLPKVNRGYLSELCKSEDRFESEDYSQDDEIIAAANAEALANDDDGLYGQEFGFYASPGTPDNADSYEIGGYFGPIGLDRTNKSQSSRHGSHEPSLSPITERSEYSNRNSYMSLNIHSPDFVRNRVSPGLGQLAGFMPWDDHERNISFEPEIKLIQ